VQVIFLPSKRGLISFDHFRLKPYKRNILSCILLALDIETMGDLYIVIPENTTTDDFFEALFIGVIKDHVKKGIHGTVKNLKPKNKRNQPVRKRGREIHC